NGWRRTPARVRSAAGYAGQRIPMNMELEHELAFDAGDNTALVCVDHQQFQKMIAPQLIDINFKVHIGLHEEDVLLKLRTYSYNVVVIYENFKGSTPATNPILKELTRRPGAQRRQ